ncbi:uncharacterized protein FTJAE_12089 [Fusarium tjaetaba]|uniref:Uncharacterized protein n=1 Tax=Fusarium tjaetaba TaxID=1567544 RepID=A0A8H5QQJ8_9HYPO|nr:uncharacterized protein FTJAE_12089 [Fusarium tjaetaba]KAF5618958.1 hypothetical protein FTJAE_12089 [Fusarium tjaetaba]
MRKPLSSRLERGANSHSIGITPTAPQRESLLDVKGALLIPEIRMSIYGKMVEIESTTRGFQQDHHGRFLCPVDVTGLPPYLTHPITQFVRAQFNLDPAQVPRLRAQVNIFHTDSFPQGVSLPRHRMTQIAHEPLKLSSIKFEVTVNELSWLQITEKPSALWDASEPLMPPPALDNGIEALEIEAPSSCSPDGKYDLGRLSLKSPLDNVVPVFEGNFDMSKE